MKLFNMMKGFFGRSASQPAPEERIETSPASPEEVNAAMESIESGLPLQAAAHPAAPAEPVEIVKEPAKAPAQTTVVDLEHSQVTMPLSTLIAAFPVELQQRVKTECIGGAQISFPLDKIVSQLSKGLVRVSFGDIRQSAQDAFFAATDRDYVMVTLPLNELVSRLGSKALALRSRKQAEIPAEITSPFGEHGQGLTIGRANGGVSSGTSFSARPRGAQSAAPIPPAADPRARGNVTSVRKPLPPGAPGTSFAPKNGTSFIANPSARPAAPVPPPSNGGSLPPGKIPAPKPPVGPAPLARSLPAVADSGLEQKSPARPSVPPVPSAAPANLTPLQLAFSAISDALPEMLRAEVDQLGLANATISLPADQIEAGLKRGKVVFTWKQLRTSVIPAQLPSVSAHDDLQVSLPLAVIAPLFLRRQTQSAAAAPAQKRVKVDEKIPNLFFGFPQPEAPAVEAPAPQVPPPEVPAAREIPVLPAPKPVETNYFVWDDHNDQAGTTEMLATAPAKPAGAAPASNTTFSSRKATPSEVVTKASMLQGIYGALVVLPDGLLVASKLDPAQSGDAIAALIPQMYSRLSGCTKELRMGELNNLKFTVGNVPWKIFRVNGIFFAVYGCAGEPLPGAHLAELAAELDYKKTK